MAIERKQLHEIIHNQRIKEYPDGVLEVLTASCPVFRETGYQDAKKWDTEPRRRSEGPPSEDQRRENINRAVRRAKNNLRDLALCNGMKYFVTLTLDAAKVDRYDAAAIIRKVNAWCSNQVQRNGLAYILVPERHKDGAIHFHGFVNGAVRVVDSGTVSLPGHKQPRKPGSEAQRAQWLAEGGQIVYNLPDWTLGFTTAIALYGDHMKAVNYCCKYIGKQQEGSELPERIGGRWFYHGGCSERPKVTYADVDFNTMEVTSNNVWAYDVPAIGGTFIREIINA